MSVLKRGAGALLASLLLAALPFTEIGRAHV